jgi:acetylornithine deacetylase/succinyl-diaminopimelate desuccinylase-like protein
MVQHSHLDAAADLDGALAMVERLCVQPSVAARGTGLEETASLVEALLAEAGFSTRQLRVDDAPPAVYGEQRGRSPFTVLLYNHYDVQPPDPIELWDSPPFDPTVRGGKLYARGVADNKGEIAARLAAVHALRNVAGALPLNVRWIVEGEEEVGSPHFHSLAGEHADLLRADGCLWEGQGFDTDDRPEIALGAKGVLYVQLDTCGTGRDAHSGAAPILPSAAWRLVRALASIRDLSGRVLVPGFYDAVCPPTTAQLDALSDQTDMEAELRQAYGVEAFVDGLTGLRLRERLAFSPTANIAGLLSGYTGEGTKTVLPALAMAKMDFRLVPDQTPSDVLSKLRAHLDAEGFEDVVVTMLASAEPVATPVDHPFVRLVLSVSRRFAQKPPSISPLMDGTLPLLGALQRYVGVPGLSAPGNPSYWGSGSHAPNEHIRLADLERAISYGIALLSGLGEVDPS